MMECDDTDVISVYFAAIDIFQHAESLFHYNKHYPTILQELKLCCAKLDEIIILETNHECFLKALFQQKQQLSLLIDIAEKLMLQEEPHSASSTSDCLMFQENATYNCNQSKVVTKKDYDENEKLMSIIQSTIETPKVGGLDDIVGLKEIKKTLKSLVILPRTQPQLFFNRKLCNNILLFGPPGTGKTRLVHAIAAQANAVFYCILASDVLSHYVGQTEKTIKTLFHHLKTNHTFSVLFIDEVDTFCRKRTDSEQDHTRRIKTEFMCQLSSVEDQKEVFVICATNCPWDLDTAILRRFQKRIYVPLPNELERLEYFQHFTKNDQFEDSQEWNWVPLLQKTRGYSFSDLSDIIQCALNFPLTELEDTKIWKYAADGFYEPVLCEQDFCNVICSELNDLPANSIRTRKVQMSDLFHAAEAVIFTVPQADLKKYDQFIGQ